MAKKINEDVLKIGQSNFKFAEDDGYQKDAEGGTILTLKPKVLKKIAKENEKEMKSIEDKVREFRKRQESIDNMKKRTDKVQEEKKKKKKDKSASKTKKKIVSGIFNSSFLSNAGVVSEEEKAEDAKSEGGSKKKSSKKSKSESKDHNEVLKERFQTQMKMLVDLKGDMDTIADTISEELEKTAKSTKTMYKSSQTSNLISSKTAAFNIVKEMNSISKYVTDHELKREVESNKKAKKDDAAGNSDKQFANFASMYLKAGSSAVPGGKKSKKKEKNYKFKTGKDGKKYDDDDMDNDEALAKRLANEIGKRNISYTAKEKHIDMEGKYKIVVSVDPLNPKKSWKFVVLDNNGKKIKGFAKKYVGLVPDPNDCDMKFDMDRGKATDKAHPQKIKYDLIIKA